MSSQRANGSERLDSHGGRRLTVQGVGLVEILQHEVVKDGETLIVHTVVALEPLGPDKQAKLDAWVRHEWPKRTN